MRSLSLTHTMMMPPLDQGFSAPVPGPGLAATPSVHWSTVRWLAANKSLLRERARNSSPGFWMVHLKDDQDTGLMSAPMVFVPENAVSDQHVVARDALAHMNTLTHVLVVLAWPLPSPWISSILINRTDGSSEVYKQYAPYVPPPRPARSAMVPVTPATGYILYNRQYLTMGQLQAQMRLETAGETGNIRNRDAIDRNLEPYDRSQHGRPPQTTVNPYEHETAQARATVDRDPNRARHVVENNLRHVQDQLMEMNGRLANRRPTGEEEYNMNRLRASMQQHKTQLNQLLQR